LEATNFDGLIPHTYNKGNGLELVSFAQNQLQEKLTRSFANCTMLKILDIFTLIDFSSNTFGGGISKPLGELKALQLLNLSNYELSGGIPSSLRYLSNLQAFDPARNKLSREIPQQLS